MEQTGERAIGKGCDTSSNKHDLPKWATNMAQRMTVAREPGAYTFIVIVEPSGARRLIEPFQPAKVEELGRN